MLHGVRQALRDGEVDRRLHRRGQPVGQVQLDGDRDGEVERQGRHRSTETTVREHRGVDPADDVGKLADRRRRRSSGLVDQPSRSTRSVSMRSSASPRLSATDASRACGASCRSRSIPPQLGRRVVDHLGARRRQRLHPTPAARCARAQERPVDHRTAPASAATPNHQTGHVTTATSSSTASRAITNPPSNRPQRPAESAPRSAGTTKPDAQVESTAFASGSSRCGTGQPGGARRSSRRSRAGAARRRRPTHTTTSTA